MAGIRYRSCEFDDPIGEAVATYQEYVGTRNRTFRANVLSTVAQLEGFTDVQDLDDKLQEALRALGIADRNALRSRFGLPAKPTSPDEREVWLYDTVGTVVIKGQYLIHDARSIQLAPYRTAYQTLGLTTLEQGMAAGAAYHVRVVHEGVVYSASPKSVAHQLDITIGELDEILVLWYGSAKPAYRTALLAQGLSAQAVYAALRGRPQDNVLSLVLARVDLFAQLRAMGLDTVAITTLLDRTVAGVTIDTAVLRVGDTEESLPGPFQSYPYPSEIGRAFRNEIALYPQVGDRNAVGAGTYIAPLTVLMRVLDLQKTFGGASMARRTSDKIGASQQRGQAALSVSETQFNELTKSFEAFQPQADHYIEQGSLIEETMAFFGIGAECGTNTKASGGGFNFWDTVLSDSQQGAIDNLVDEWGSVGANLNFKGDLLGGLGISLGKLSCEAVAFGCQSNAIVPDLGGEGGPWDVDGGVNVAIDNLSDAFKATERLLESFQDVGPNLSLASVGLGNLKGLRTEPCESPANVGFLTDVGFSG